MGLLLVTLPELYNWLEKLTPEPRVGSFGTDEPGSDFIFVAQLGQLDTENE